MSFLKFRYMENLELSIPEQVKIALDGRKNRWLALEIKMPETELSKRMNGHIQFSENEIAAINERLGSDIKLTSVTA